MIAGKNRVEATGTVFVQTNVLIALPTRTRHNRPGSTSTAPSRKSNGLHLRCSDRRIFRRLSGADSLLRVSDGQGRQVMNWAYWLSGIATLGIFVYLLIALFKPELFS
jgi:F subunit of K+-transporting ATPase (Potass_KdpF)